MRQVKIDVAAFGITANVSIQIDAECGDSQVREIVLDGIEQTISGTVKVFQQQIAECYANAQTRSEDEAREPL